MSTQSEKQVSPKVVAGGAAGALTIVLAWIAQDFAGITVPTEVGMAFTVLVGVAAAWLRTDPLRRDTAKHGK